MKIGRLTESAAQKISWKQLEDYKYKFSYIWNGGPNSTYADDLLYIANLNNCLCIYINPAYGNRFGKIFICKDEEDYNSVQKALEDTKLSNFIRLGKLQAFNVENNIISILQKTSGLTADEFNALSATKKKQLAKHMPDSINIDDYNSGYQKLSLGDYYMENSLSNKRITESAQSSYKKGDRVYLIDTNETGTVAKDFDWQNEDRVAVEIDGLGKVKYVLSTQLRDLHESLNETSSTDPYGLSDIKKMLNNRAPQHWWVKREIEMDFGDGDKLASYLSKKGVDVKFDSEEDMWFVKGKYHFSDCYFYPYEYRYEEDAITESTTMKVFEDRAEKGQTRSSRYTKYFNRIKKALETGDEETLQRTKEAIMYAPAKELRNSEASKLMSMIKNRKINDGSINEGFQPADEWYLKINPNDIEGAKELEGLFIDDVIKDKGALEKYGFSDRLKSTLDNLFKRYSARITNESATHCVYFNQDGRDQIEFEGTEDECDQYIRDIEAEQDDEFGDEAPERYIKKLTESVKGAHFQVGDVIEYSSLYGGSITLTVEKIQGTKMWVDKSWIAEDTGETMHAKDHYFIQKDEEGNDCIIAWSYAGEQGLIYPPSTNREVEDNTVDKEAEIAELAKEMYEKGVECCSYDEFRRFMLDNNDTPTRELYKVYDDAIMSIAKGEEMQEAVEHVPARNETIDRCLPIIKGTIHKAIREYDDTGILFDLGSNMHVIKNNAERVLKEIRALKDSQNNTNMQESFNDGWTQRFAGMNVFRNGDYQIKSVILSSGEDGWELGTWNNGKYRRIDVFKDIDKAKKKAYDLKYPLGESIQEDAYTAQRYLDSELPDMLDHIISLIPNLREVEIRNIISASRKFYTLLEGIAARHSDVVKESLDESLFEDVEVEAKSGPEEGPEFGLSSLVNQAIQDEFKTIDMYNSIALTAKEEGFEDIVAVIDDINTEENKHVGQLQEILKTISPNAEAIDAGEIEGAEQIVDGSINNSNSSPNNINEGDAGMTDRAREIYNSFKEIEKELNGDGEAITVVIDKLYDDNREDPDYKIAYTRWADGE